jgi:hypothetical protein
MGNQAAAVARISPKPPNGKPKRPPTRPHPGPMQMNATTEVPWFSSRPGVIINSHFCYSSGFYLQLDQNRKRRRRTLLEGSRSLTAVRTFACASLQKTMLAGLRFPVVAGRLCPCKIPEFSATRRRIHRGQRRGGRGPKDAPRWVAEKMGETGLGAIWLARLDRRLNSRGTLLALASKLPPARRFPRKETK